ncbi:MAG: RluA family pseudouridine synthase [Kiritimatiellia bacterium]|jgi:23S rRNA pseudouridine1911/1915/1917 synthase
METPSHFDEDACGPDDGCVGRRVFDVASGEGAGRLDAWLAARMDDLSRARIGALIDAGNITRNGAPAKPSAKVRDGDRIVVVLPPPEPAEPQPEEIPLSILHEDSDLLVLDKPAGLVVHPAPGHSSGTLVNALLFHCRDLAGIGGVERPGIVHRLDRDTSGLMVVAKHDAALANLQRQFQAGSVTKGYLALVHGSAPAEGEIAKAIGRDPRDRKRMKAPASGGKPALSRFRAIERFGALATLLAVRIQTGRTHQIRVHLSSIGLPIAGDPVYGDSRKDRRLPDCPRRQMLHAALLSFAHPSSGAPLSFEAPPPPDMAGLLGRLRFYDGF